jgi:hypothetical protein
VDTGGANGRLRALADDITTVRERLDVLVDELDRRRHEALDWHHHLRRHARQIAVGTLTVALAAAVVVAYGAGWLDAGRLTKRRAGALSASWMPHRFRRG